MRIIFVGDSEAKKRKRRGVKRRSRGSRVFQSSIAVPQPMRRGSGVKTRPKGGGRKSRTRGPQSQATRTRTARTRAERLQRAQQAAGAPSASILQQIRWRSAVWRLLALAMLIGLLVVIAFVSSDVSFFVYRNGTQILGTRYMPADEVFAASAVNELNIFWIDPVEVARRVVALDGVKAARVRCDLPARVTIEVEEREPVVMWRALSQGQDLWLDEEGIVLPYHGDVNSPDMVFVVDHGERSLQVGDRIEPEGVVQSVLQLAGALPGEQVYSYEPGRGLSFIHTVNNGEWPVYVGTSDDLARKIQVVQALTEYLVANSIRPRYLDVRWAEHPVYGKPEGGTLVGGD